MYWKECSREYIANTSHTYEQLRPSSENGPECRRPCLTDQSSWMQMS